MEVENKEIFTYTDSQKKVINMSSILIKDSIKNNLNFTIKIIGSAGTGKTTVVSGILEEVLKDVRVVPTIVAPTHKALSVIQEKISDYFKNTNKSFKYKTIASILKMERVYNYETLSSDFTMGNNTENQALIGEKLIIIDEASMVTGAQYNMILKLAERYKIVVVFLGDIKQLPPIKESSSPAVVAEISANMFSFVLTEIIRQGVGNPILEVAHNLKLVKEFVPHLKNSKGYLFSVSEESVLINLAKAGGSSEMKYLAWSNSDVDSTNLKVREKAFGSNPQELYIGESIISQSNSKEANNNEEIKIESISNKKIGFQICSSEQLHSLDKKYQGKYNTIDSFSEINTFDGVVIHDTKVYVVLDTMLINNKHRTVTKEYHKYFKQAVQIMKQLVKNRKIGWRVAVDFEDAFLKYKYAYASSTHKSQGSTFKNVIINLRDLERNKKEFNEILYTAITRASDKVIFYYPVKKEGEEDE